MPFNCEVRLHISLSQSDLKKKTLITIFILVTWLIPLCDVYCYRFLKKPWLLCSISILWNESNVSIWRRSSLVGKYGMCLEGSCLWFQVCHQRDPTRLIPPGRVFIAGPFNLCLSWPACGVTCSVCHSCRGDQPGVFLLCLGSRPLRCSPSQLFWHRLTSVSYSALMRFQHAVKHKVRVVPPFADLSVYLWKCVRTRTAVSLNLSFGLSY